MDQQIYDQIWRQNELLRKQNEILKEQLAEQTQLLNAIATTLRDMPKPLVVLAKEQQ